MQHCFSIKFNYYVPHKRFLLTQWFSQANAYYFESELDIAYYATVRYGCDAIRIINIHYNWILFRKMQVFIHFSIFPWSLFSTAGTCVVSLFLSKTNAWLDSSHNVKMYSPHISKSRLFLGPKKTCKNGSLLIALSLSLSHSFSNSVLFCF